MNKVSVYSLPFNIGFHSDRENWFTNREFYFEFETETEGEKAAEEAFVITNAPDDVLTDEQKELIKDFHGPSLSTGDVVKIENKLRISGDNHEPEYYLCKSFGWEKFDDSVIELIKYLKE